MHQKRCGHHGHHHHAGKSSESLLNKEIILKELNLVPGAIILDAGCGNGYMSKAFAAKLNNTGRIYALDPDKNAIDNLKKEVKDTIIMPLVGDITQKTELEASSFDLIYLSTVLHGFRKPEIEGFQKEVRRLLKPKGVLAIIEIKKEPTPFGPPLEMRFSPPELRELIKLAPLKEVEAGTYFYMQLFEKKE